MIAQLAETDGSVTVPVTLTPIGFLLLTAEQERHGLSRSEVFDALLRAYVRPGQHAAA